ncbi:MAG: hypothetical protein VX498_13885, partial [Myxococcota bacterium]|nr:hypothetical protein [Myxococcota bacterium]
LEALGLPYGGNLLDFLGLYTVLGPTTGGESSSCDGCGGEGCAELDGCSGEEGCAGLEGCGEEEGCGGEEGCDVESQMAEAGCSGEASEIPSDTGCQGCRLIAHQSKDGQWRITIGHQGSHAGPRGGFRIGLAHLLLVLAPILFLGRRQRRGRERLH